jgi:hypothetical protein
MKELNKLYKYLRSKKNKKILFLTTSNRWSGDKELPKSSMIAEEIAKKFGDIEIINISKLKIFPCEGNVSTKRGNTCGIKDAILLEKEVLSFFGFKTPDVLSFSWQWTNDKNDESKSGYLSAFGDFLKQMNFVDILQESVKKFKEWIRNI